MKILKKKLEPYFGGMMDVYTILEGGQRVLMGQMQFDGKDPCDGTFQVAAPEGERILILSSKQAKSHVRILYYAVTVYQLDIPTGATKVPLRVDRR